MYIRWQGLTECHQHCSPLKNDDSTVLFATLIVYCTILLLGYTHVWIGLTDVVDEGQYVYASDGVKPRYSNWYKTEPGGGRGENCACLDTEQRKWNDYPCSSKMSYVCKKPAKHFV